MAGDFFEHIVERELFALRWREPNPEAVGDLNRVIAQRAAEFGAPLIVITILEADTPVPDRATRTAFEEGMLSHGSDVVASYHAVLVGGGLKVTIMRSILTGLMLVVGVRGMKAMVHKELADMAAFIGQQDGHDARRFLDWLGRHAFIPGAELEDARSKLAEGSQTAEVVERSPLSSR